MVRQLRITEIHQLKDSMKRVRVARNRKGSATHRELRRTATVDVGLIAQAKLASAVTYRPPPGPRTPTPRSSRRGFDASLPEGSPLGRRRDSLSPLLLPAKAQALPESERKVPKEEEEANRSRRLPPVGEKKEEEEEAGEDVEVEEGEAEEEQVRMTEERKVRLAEAGVKGIVEEGEGDGESEYDEDEEEDEEDEDEDDIENVADEGEGSAVDSNNLHYVQNFLLRRRKTELSLSLTKRLQGYVQPPPTGPSPRGS
jgi:hypothetical protein